MCQIQIASDIHLEYYKNIDNILKKLKPNKNSILVLAGDIGKPRLPTYDQLLSWVSKNYKSVVLIAGNHEYYHSNKIYSHVLPTITELTKKYDNIHFLENGSVMLDGIKFIGCTLWSDVYDGDDKYIIERTIIIK